RSQRYFQQREISVARRRPHSHKKHRRVNSAARPAATSSVRISRMHIKSFIAVISLIIGFAGVLAETPARGAEADVHAAVQRWVETLGSGKGEAPIAALYAPEAILLSTFDAKPLDTPAEIAAYFHKLTQTPNLKATVQTEKIQTFADDGTDSGLYTFSYTKDRNEVRMTARFTFVFHRTTT